MRRELDVLPLLSPYWEASWSLGSAGGRREGAITYCFLSLLLEMHEEDRAEREQRSPRERKLASP